MLMFLITVRFLNLMVWRSKHPFSLLIGYSMPVVFGSYITVTVGGFMTRGLYIFFFLMISLWIKYCLFDYLSDPQKKDYVYEAVFKDEDKRNDKNV